MTTIVSVRDGKKVVVAGDGQVSIGDSVMKGTAKKVRRISDGNVIVGFAGSTADAMTLFEKLEGKLEQYNRNLVRAAVELAKEWRGDKYLRKLEALMIAADQDHTLLLSGNGDVLEPDEGLTAIGSGGNFALAAARALSRNSDLDAEQICRESMKTAAEICVYTNDYITLEVIDRKSS